ncbi:uncharacterized protein K444DRAFT_258297, partial [Hyaloscypha bicolor E]
KSLKITDASSVDFVKTYLPHYSGPQVKVQIGSPDHEYTLSKAILCQHYRYFANMFDGGFKEGKEDIAKLDELEGTVSVRSFELLIQWIYTGRVIVETTILAEEIEAIVEFARLADFCQVEGVEKLVAERIKALIGTKADLDWIQSPDNTKYITSRAILWASFLPGDHAVRNILAAASVEGYLRSNEHKFDKETRSIHNFAADLLKEVKLTLGTLTGDRNVGFYVEDPISGGSFSLGPTYGNLKW